MLAHYSKRVLSFKSPNPALKVFLHQKDVACDIVYSDVPTIYDGSTAAVIFVGVNTQVTDVYGINSDKQFVNTLEDNIIQRVAPLKLISDRAQSKKLQKSFVPSVLTTGRVNPITSTRIQLKDANRPSRIVLTAFLIAWSHCQYLVVSPSICVFYAQPNV
jgi:hypothetical protein